ncbi:MAG: DUF368 domain-containing protein [Pseudomonadota bacterium]
MTDVKAEGEPRRPLQWLGVYLRGMVMGTAELVPGVSGGTIAFVTGIYDELVHTLAGLKPQALAKLGDGLVPGCRRIWLEHNLGFLLVLGLGMLTSIVLLAQALHGALETHRPVVWGFFLGIIVLSIWLLGRDLSGAALWRYGPVGCLAGVMVIFVEPFSGSTALPVFFIAAAIAVSAWLLPAVSGSFVLLTLGLYESVIGAIAGLQWDVLLVFAAGCVAGLLAFSRLLSVALHRFRDPLLAFLTGFMAGACGQLWPWQLEGAHVLPDSYVAAGELAYLGLTGGALVAGALAILALSRLAR